MENEYFAEVKTLKHGFNAKRIGYKWGLYDDEGTILMRPLYDYISSDQEGRIWARYKGKKFFVEENKLPYPFDFIHDSEIDKEWYVIESNGYLGVVDKHLKTLIPMDFKYIIDYGGILWITNDYQLRDPISTNTGYFDCSLFTYTGNLITNNKYNLIGFGSFGPPSFPIVKNKKGFNIINNDKKEVLSIPAQSIKKINDWFIIEIGNENFLYNIESNSHLSKYRYSKIDYATHSRRKPDVFICKRLTEPICDVYKDGELVASYNTSFYDFVDIADEFIIVWSWYYRMYRLFGNKQLVYSRVYDRITVRRGAINIVIAEVFEKITQEHVENAIYVNNHSYKLPNYYVTKGWYDVFGFDGHRICENNDVITSSLLWNMESDNFFIEQTKEGTIKQFNSSGFIKQFNEIDRASWNMYNHGLELHFKNGSSVSIPVSHSCSTNEEMTKSVQKLEQKTYSAFHVATELSGCDYLSNDRNCLSNDQSFNNSKQICKELVFHEGLSPVFMYGKWGFVNENGDTVIPFVYDEAEPFSDGLAAVKKGKYFGFIDYNNKVVINFKFIKVEPFNEGLAKFVDAFDSGCISKDGYFVERNSKKSKFNKLRINYARDSWDAMTDGMYGDYPGSGSDYDPIGFGI